MTDIYLIEATFEYAEQVWQFRQEVFDDDNNSESQFAGCLSLDEAASAEEWIKMCQLRKNAATCKQTGSDVPLTTYFAVHKNDNRIAPFICTPKNTKELIELLCPDAPKSFPEATLQIQSELFQKEGFSIIRGEEACRSIKFFDVGALVWFAKIIEWEFQGFSVENNFDKLIEAQRILDCNGYIDGTIHRYLIVAQKQ